MNRVRIAHGGREVQIDTADGPLVDVVAAAIHTWQHTAPTSPDREPADAGGFGLALQLHPAHLELAEER